MQNVAEYQNECRQNTKCIKRPETIDDGMTEWKNMCKLWRCRRRKNTHKNLQSIVSVELAQLWHAVECRLSIFLIHEQVSCCAWPAFTFLSSVRLWCFFPSQQLVQRRNTAKTMQFSLKGVALPSLGNFIFCSFLRRMSAENQSAKHQKILRVSHELWTVGMPHALSICSLLRAGKCVKISKTSDGAH